MDDKNTFRRGPVARQYRRRSDVDRRSIGDISGEAELRLAIDATGLGIFDFYPLTEELHWSHTAKEHFGLSPDAHVNYNVFLVGLHPEDRERVDQLIHDALQSENGGKYSTEYRTIGIEDGKERWIAARGQAFFNRRGEAVRFIGTTLDITDRKKTEDALRESREHYRLLFDKSPLPKWVVDLETSSFLEINEAAADQYGYSREEFMKMTLGDISSDRPAGVGPPISQREPAHKTTEGRFRATLRKKNGGTAEVEVQFTEIVYNGRRAVLGVVLDRADLPGGFSRG